MTVQTQDNSNTLHIELPDQNPEKRHDTPVFKEGADGLYSQSWFPICLSEELEKGKVLGVDFLDGKVVAYRGEDGVARVMSAYCPHVGADLSVGCVIENRLQCAFHQWEYDQQGGCVKTAIGDPAPKTARLFKFPSQEHYGIVWAFNGNEPLWYLPAFEHPPETMAFRTYRLPGYPCDPWVICANTPDMQHLKVVHKAQFSMEDPHDLVKWEKYGFNYNIIAAHQGGVPIEWRLAIRGTSIFWQEGLYGDFWLGGMTGFALQKSGCGYVLAVIALDTREADSEEQLEERFAISEDLMRRTIGEDRDILSTISYKPGSMTRGDKTLSKYLQLLRKYPRAHPSAAFIK